jgi:phosphoribosylglycinamide formyltransferase 1
VRLVLSRPRRAHALERAEAAGVAAVHVPFGRDRDGFERRADALLREHAIDLVCLAGFMRVLSPPFVERWEGRVLNVHPSLLPAFRGLHAQRQALEAGVRESGCTVHFVDAGVDTGHAIVQRRVPVEAGDDEASLAARILEQEHLAYPEAVRLVLRGEVRP